MGRFVLVWLILAESMMVQAMAVRSMGGSELNPQRVLMGGAGDGVAAPPVSSDAEPSASEGVGEAPGVAQAPERHRSSDRSVAGGGVIVGGLVTVAFAAVYCYIRVTRRRDGAGH